jgi:phosphoribosylformylglycinamidine cyclo-ligase
MGPKPKWITSTIFLILLETKYKPMVDTYAQTGVDVTKIRSIQNGINAKIMSTHNEYIKKNIPGHYAAPFEVNGQKMTIHCDGVGSKILVAQHLERHDTIGIDAVAMNANDLICMGSKPIVGVDYLALSRTDDELIEQIMQGLVAGCEEAGIALIGGETAILPDMLKGTAKSEHADYDLAMTVVGITEGDHITGEDIEVGDVLIGLGSSGLHSNGFTLARRVLDMEQWAEHMLIPTKIYVKAVLEMIKETDVHGIAHITGGAFSKLSRIGKFAGVGFLLDSMPEPVDIFEELKNQLKDDRELYRTFNMGVGMVLAVEKTDAESIIRIANNNHIGASVIGKAIEGNNVLLQKEEKKVSLL